MSSIETRDLFDLTHTLAASFLRDCRRPWQAFPQISGWIRELGAVLSVEEYEQRGEDVWVACNAKIAPTAYIAGPAITGPGAEVRHCAFIRGSVLVGADCVVGNSTELKNIILFGKVQVPYYNYVGDSILGYRSHMGAGFITSSVKSDKTLAAVRSKDGILETGLKKFGAILGDSVRVGCNLVLNPDTVVGSGSTVYPLSMVRGVILPNSIYKCAGGIAERKQRRFRDGTARKSSGDPRYLGVRKVFPHRGAADYFGGWG